MVTKNFIKFSEELIGENPELHSNFVNTILTPDGCAQIEMLNDYVMTEDFLTKILPFSNLSYESQNLNQTTRALLPTES